MLYHSNLSLCSALELVEMWAGAQRCLLQFRRALRPRPDSGISTVSVLKPYLCVNAMLTCINVIWPATGLRAGAGRRTTGVEDIINRTLHLTVIYRLTLIRAAERERPSERLSNTPVMDSCRQAERNTEKGAEIQKTVTD